MARIILRRAEPADWPSMWPLWHEVVKAGDTYCLDPESTSEEGRDGWLAAGSEAEHPREQTWIAVDAAGPVVPAVAGVLGTYHLSPNQAGPGSHVVNGSYMVATAARGRGIGRAIVEHSLVQAALAGYAAIQFNAVTATNINSLALYDSLGFAIVGRVPRGFRHPQQGLVDLIILHRALEPTANNEP